MCDECGSALDSEQMWYREWPCPTVRALTPADEWAMPCGGCGACKWSMAGEGSICDGTGMIREVLEAAEDSDEEETT